MDIDFIANAKDTDELIKIADEILAAADEVKAGSGESYAEIADRVRESNPYLASLLGAVNRKWHELENR